MREASPWRSCCGSRRGRLFGRPLQDQFGRQRPAVQRSGLAQARKRVRASSSARSDRRGRRGADAGTDDPGDGGAGSPGSRRTRKISRASPISPAGFFAQNGLLFLARRAGESLGGVDKGAPLIQDLATDPSLRGLLAGLEDALIGVKQGKVSLDDFARPLNMAADALENILAGRPASFSWRALATGKPATPMELRGFIELRPRARLRSRWSGAGRDRQFAADRGRDLADLSRDLPADRADRDVRRGIRHGQGECRPQRPHHGWRSCC